MGSEITAVAAQTFLLECAAYFGKRDTGGEDMAFWANIANQRNCEGISALLQSQAAEIERLTRERDELVAGFDRLASAQNAIVHKITARAESAEADLARAREALENALASGLPDEVANAARSALTPR